VEIQGTAEGEPFDQTAMTEMLNLAQAGISELVKHQKATLKV
jgi:ribonuclease PH